MARSLVIGNRTISDDSDCYVIAEIGHNHQGELEKAKQLFRQAKECGADAVKLQKRDNKTLYTRSMYNKPYEHENSFGPTYGAHREALEFGRKEYLELQRYASELGLDMFATAFDFASADFLAEFDVPAFKIASGDLKNTPLLKYVAKIGKPVIVSTGGGTLGDVRRAHDAIMPINPHLCLLQCTASYPAPPEELNLRVITTYREQFPDAVIGLSDHENGIAMAVAAYVLGARVVEKHFTLNHTWKGTDHAFSLEPIGMRKLVRDLRRARLALGDGVKTPYPSEAAGLYKMGKKLVAARHLPAGHLFTLDDIALKSPNDGLPPYELDRVIGKVTRRALQEDENLTFEDLVERPQPPLVAAGRRQKKARPAPALSAKGRAKTAGGF
jgi:N-acetylneuraminate synthase/sialic acid synthase